MINSGALNLNQLMGFNNPLVLNSGQEIRSELAYGTEGSINGYLVDEDYFADCGGGGGSSSTPSSIDSAMVADMIAANTSSGSGGDWELLYDELNTNNDEPYGTVNRYGIAQSDGFLYLVGSYATVYTGNDHDTITNTWPENPILQNISANDPNEAHIIPLKKNMSWHIEFHSTLGYITKGYFIPNGGGSASLANGGMSGTSKSFKYPDGMHGTPITIAVGTDNSYTVPEGKNLYANYFRTSSGGSLYIDGIRVAMDYNNVMNNQGSELLYVGEGQTITCDDGLDVNLNSTLNGLLVDKSVDIVSFGIGDLNSYTVPNGKNLYVNYFRPAGEGSLYINGVKVSMSYNNSFNNQGSELLYVGEGQTITCDNELDVNLNSTLNGYLADLDYFESSSSSSASNSGGGGNTMDLSVSLFGDTLYGFGNDFIIIPGISIANLHMQVDEFGSVTDIDGNTYKTLEYGDDEWMIQNLKTEIGSYVTPFNQNTTYIQPDSIGYYYSTSDLENVCPTGWHVATIEDWQNLHYTIFGNEMNLNGQTVSNQGLGDDSYQILWSQDLNSDIPGTNLSYFNLFRTGWMLNSSGNVSEESRASFWTTTNCNGNKYMVNFYENGFSLTTACTSASNVKGQVRCVKD